MQMHIDCDIIVRYGKKHRYNCYSFAFIFSLFFISGF